MRFVYAWPDVLGMIRLSALGTGFGVVTVVIPSLWRRRLGRECGRHVARNLPARLASAPSSSSGGGN